jgi:hypothetical protein
MSNLWFSLFNSFYMYFIPVVKPNLVLQLLHFNFMYQRVLKIQLCMFEKKLQVKFFLKSIPNNKFGMLKIDSFNKEENIESSKSFLLYIYIYIYR